MAEKRIEYSDLINPDALEKLQSELKQVQKELEKNNDSLKESVKLSNKIAQERPLEGYDNLKAVNEQVDKLQAQIEQLQRSERKRKEVLTEQEKLEKRLNRLREEGAQDLANLREQIRLENKALRDNARAQAEAGDAFKVLTRQTNEAQANFKRLAVEFGANSEQAKEAYKSFVVLDDKLRAVNDTARDGRRDVGRYRIATERLSTAFDRLQKATIILTILSKLGDSFSANSEGAAALDKLIGRLTVTLSVFVNRAVKLIPLVSNSFNNFFDSIELGSKKVGLFLAEFPELLGGSADKAKKLKEEIAELEKGMSKEGLTLEAITEAFDGMGKEIDELIDKNDKLVDSVLDNRRKIIELKKEEADLLALREKLQGITDDDNRSLKERREAITGVADAVRDETGAIVGEVKEKNGLLAVDEKLAQLRERQAKLLFDDATERARITKGDVALQEQATELYAQFQQARADALANRMRSQTILGRLELDQLDADLDILIDVADRRKTILERQAQDETLTYEQRIEAAKQARQGIDESFAESIRKISEQQGIEIDFERIIATEDTVELEKYVRSLETAERPQNRLRELIIERLQATQDNVEAQKELNKAVQEGEALSLDIKDQEEALKMLEDANVDLTKVLEKLQEKRAQNQIDELKRTIEQGYEKFKERALEENEELNDGELNLLYQQTEEYLKAKQSLNEKLLTQKQAQAEKERAIDEQAAQDRIELAENVSTFLENIAKERQEKRLERIDEAIEASKEQEGVLLEVVQQGSQEALQALEFERKKQAELALEREKQAKKEARTEILLAASKIYAAKVAGDTPAGQALAETASEILSLEALVKSLPTFFKGTEDTGTGGGLDGKGGFLSVLHPNERVVPKSVNEVIPKAMSNAEVGIASRDWWTNKREGRQSAVNIDISGLQSEMQAVRKAIEQKPVIVGANFDAQNKAVTYAIKEGKKLKKQHRNIGING